MVAGVIAHFAFSFAVLFSCSVANTWREHVTPAQFIPAVGLVVMPLAAYCCLAQFEGVAREWVLTINIIGLGRGA